MDCPRARHDLEFIPLIHEGQRMILVRDRLELVPEGTGFDPEFLPVLQMLDGNRTVDALATAFTAMRGGETVTPQAVNGLLGELDAAGLLVSARYESKLAAVTAAFAASPVRQPAFAGQAYPDETLALSRFLDDMLDTAEPVRQKTSACGRIAAVIAPHIDPEAGRPGYAAAYAALRGRSFPRRVVVLGVGHQVMDGLFCLTDKAFATPLGPIEADTAAVAALRAAGKTAVDFSDIPHRAEHSVEFQTIFLRHVLGEGFSLVPILCGSPQGCVPTFSRRGFRDTAGPFLDALRELADDPDTLIVAGVDLCHIGLKFGHAEPAVRLEEAAMAHDQTLLKRLCAGDADGFWAESARVQDAYNVCGLTALAVLAEILPEARGRVLCHDILRESSTQSAVTFAAAVFPRP